LAWSAPDGQDLGMTAAGFVAFLVASFLLAIVPGVGTAMLVKQSVRGGRRAAFATVGGLELGVAFWAVAAGLGLSMLLVASEVAYQALRVVGVLVLLWFGVRALFGRRRDVDEPTPRGGFRAGLLVNLANPKLAVFAVSFLPQFVAPGAGRWVLLTLAAVWVVVDTLWYLIIAALLTKVIRWLKRHQHKLERITGGVLIGLGVKLALDR
jgi:threonine/homoserine/homoserine lactone efflux protein